MPLRISDRQSILIFVLVGITCAVLTAGCSKPGVNSLQVKSPAAGDQDLTIKSAFANPVTKTFTDASGNVTTAVAYNVHAANYDLDAGRSGANLNNPMVSDDNLRITLSLVGEAGTKENSPLKAGTYSAKADKYMKVDNVGIVTRKGGTETKNWFDRSSLNGEVNVTSVSDDSASVEIDVRAGDSAIKGSFTAKILKRK